MKYNIEETVFLFQVAHRHLNLILQRKDTHYEKNRYDRRRNRRTRYTKHCIDAGSKRGRI